MGGTVKIFREESKGIFRFVFFLLSLFAVGANVKELEKRIKLLGFVTAERFDSVTCVAGERNRFLFFFVPYFLPLRVSSTDWIANLLCNKQTLKIKILYTFVFAYRFAKETAIIILSLNLVQCRPCSAFFRV